MSGLDNSQKQTVDASEHAEERHEHSRAEAADVPEPALDDDQGAKAADRKD